MRLKYLSAMLALTAAAPAMAQRSVSGTIGGAHASVASPESIAVGLRLLMEMSDAERAAYRRPFLRPGEDRRPTLTWPRLLPYDGEPAEIVALAEVFSVERVERDGIITFELCVGDDRRSVRSIAFSSSEAARDYERVLLGQLRLRFSPVVEKSDAAPR